MDRFELAPFSGSMRTLPRLSQRWRIRLRTIDETYSETAAVTIIDDDESLF
jgi:hypothetical protein